MALRQVPRCLGLLRALRSDHCAGAGQICTLERCLSSAAVTSAQGEAGMDQQRLHGRADGSSVGASGTGSPPQPPWTPTQDLRKRKDYFKRGAHMIEVLESLRVEELQAARDFPKFRPGDVIKLKLVVPENRKRQEDFTGLCIAKKSKGLRSSFILRKTWPGVGAVERQFPLYSPHILELKVLSSIPVRRAKLYYMRDRRYARQTAV